jgi:Fe-S cluster assembly scaffold protein SufB
MSTQRKKSDLNCRKKCDIKSLRSDCNFCRSKIDATKQIIIAPETTSEQFFCLPTQTENQQIGIVVGAHSKVTIIESVDGLTRASTNWSNLSLQIKSQATVRLILIRSCSGGRNQQSNLQAVVEDGAKFQLCEARLGGSNIDSNINIKLTGCAAFTTVQSILFCAGRDRLTSTLNIQHLAEQTNSDISTKCVLADQARLIYSGLVTIDTGAINAQGAQRADALLLSEQTHVNLAPQLKILEKNASCSHGASISGLDQSKLYYLMSRGLTRKLAMELAARGFLTSGFTDLPVEQRAALEQALTTRLKCALKKIN